MKLLLSTLLLSCLNFFCFSQNAAYTTKYDFVSGDKVIAIADFSETELGDFPADWNTNATAEVVTVAGRPGKWLKINKEGVFFPEFIKSLPENFTLEFDLGVSNNWNSMPFVINITNLKKPEDFTNYYHFVNWSGTHTVKLEFSPSILDQRKGSSKIIAGKDGNHMVNNDVEYTAWDNGPNNFAHISLWRQNNRLRVYLNGEKIWDIPRAFDAGSKYNAITFAQQGSYNTEDYVLLSNIRLAAGAPDTRKKMRQGSFSTTGIMFDPGSDQIKPESFGTLKEIGGVLKDSFRTRVMIVGHTDSDGDMATNIDLSKRRADAVKNYLVQNFGLVADSLITFGRGATMPIDKNTSAAGKANNRRVEFATVPITVKPSAELPITVKPSNNLPITVKPQPKSAPAKPKKQ